MMLRITSSESKVVVIVTSQSLHSLHPSLVNTKGRHIFQSILEVNPPIAVSVLFNIYFYLFLCMHLNTFYEVVTTVFYFLI